MASNRELQMIETFIQIERKIYRLRELKRLGVVSRYGWIQVLKWCWQEVVPPFQVCFPFWGFTPKHTCPCACVHTCMCSKVATSSLHSIPSIHWLSVGKCLFSYSSSRSPRADLLVLSQTNHWGQGVGTVWLVELSHGHSLQPPPSHLSLPSCLSASKPWRRPICGTWRRCWAPMPTQ